MANYKIGDEVQYRGKITKLVRRNDRNGMVRWETANGGFFYEGDEDVVKVNDAHSFQNGRAKALAEIGGIGMRVGNAKPRYQYQIKYNDRPADTKAGVGEAETPKQLLEQVKTANPKAIYIRVMGGPDGDVEWGR